MDVETPTGDRDRIEGFSSEKRRTFQHIEGYLFVWL
jgi:hypothetical protein